MAIAEQAKRPGWRTWLGERFPLDVKIYEELAKEPIPRHMERWWMVLGGTPLLLFIIQAITGILLTFYYVPRPEIAYESVQRITYQIPFGWWARGIHHWASQLMIIAVALHMLRTFITGAYRRPRELNWLIGAGLLVTTLGMAFTGYALINDQRSYWATTVGTNLFAEIPLIGTGLLHLIRGGVTVTADTLTRFFPIHVLFLPAVLLILVGLHVALIRFHGVTDLDARERERLARLGKPVPESAPGQPAPAATFPFFPDHVMTELVVVMGLLIVLMNLTVLFPPPIGAPVNINETPLLVQPEWYFFPVFRWLKLFPLQVGILSLMVGAFCWIFWPFIDAFLERRCGQRDLNVYLGTVVALGAVGFILWEVFFP